MPSTVASPSTPPGSAASTSFATPGPITLRLGTLPGLRVGSEPPADGSLVGLPRYTPGEAPRVELGGSPVRPPDPNPNPAVGLPGLGSGRVVVVQGGLGDLGQGSDGDDILLHVDLLARPERFDGGAGRDQLWLAEGGSVGGHDDRPSHTLTDEQWVGVEEIHFYAESREWMIGLGAGEAAPGMTIAVSGEPENRVNLSGQSEPIAVFGGQGLTNRFITGEGNDQLVGGLRTDYLDGAGGHDRLIGMAASDLLLGGLGHDHLDGGSGDDYLLDSDGRSTGVPDDDTLIGGEGADEIVVWMGHDLVDLREEQPAADLVRVFATPSVHCRIYGFQPGQDAVHLHFYTSAFTDRLNGHLIGLQGQHGDLSLDTSQFGVFHFSRPLAPVGAGAPAPEQLLCSGRLQLSQPGDRALVVIYDPATTSSWVYAVQDINRDRHITGLLEMDLMIEVVGAQLGVGDVGP